MARSVPLLVNFLFTLVSESASPFPRGRASDFSHTQMKMCGGFFTCNFVIRLRHFRLTYSEYFKNVFIFFSQVIFEHAVVRGERESGPCIQLAIFNFSYGMPLQQKHLGSVTELANRINE